MFANTFQSGLVSIFYSCGSNPLSIWEKQVRNGHIRRVVDDEVKSLVLEISGTNVSTTYITCPSKKRISLGIKLPFLVMIIKNLKKYFTFEVQILDDKDMHRRFRVSNFQSTTRVHPFCTTMPIGLSNGWNQVQFNLADFTKRAYGSCYQETTRIQIHANIRIRRIYFSDRLYSDDEMPNEFKLFVPLAGADAKKNKQKEIKPTDTRRKSRIPATDKEIPSGAPPSPVEIESPKIADGELAAPPTEEAVSTIAEIGSPETVEDDENFAIESPDELTHVPTEDKPENGTGATTETTTEIQPSPASESAPESPDLENVTEAVPTEEAPEEAATIKVESAPEETVPAESTAEEIAPTQ